MVLLTRVVTLRRPVFLKSLTLRGFKSFADKTELAFEPGVTVVVGPNGSGKSNVVDALTWVLGSHSPKSLRGGSMSDVIFAGSATKPGLGRAAVDLTIDNSAGQLPIEFSEVTVSRGIFASGESEYAINGVECRLLDIAELLSDTGLGREGHTIVGQGQLDAVLNARPEERRAFIEEAAGILKHRHRKDRAVRKLAQTEAHVERLGDVLRELRRNLRPLERQAEAAAKHAELQSALLQVRLIRALRELSVLRERWQDERSAQASADAEFAELERRLHQQREEERRTAERLAELTPASRTAAETHFRLGNLVERYRGLSGRIAERRRGLTEAVEEPVAGRDPAQLHADAEAARGRIGVLEREEEEAATLLAEASERRGEAERARRAHDQAAAAEARRQVEARERRLRWEGEVAALRSALAQAASEEGRLVSQRSGLGARIAQLDAAVTAVGAEIQRLDSNEAVLGEQLAAAEAQLDRRERAYEAVAQAERELDRRRASLEARAEALRSASQEAGEGAEALMAAVRDGQIEGVVGPLADHVAVVDGMARAAAAALGALGDALIVSSPEAAGQAISFISSRQSGRVLLLAAQQETARGRGRAAGPSDGGTPSDAVRDRDLADLGARPLVDALRASPPILGALAQALKGVYTIDDFAAACRLAERLPDCAFVTTRGELAGPRGYSGGSAAPASAVLSRAAAEHAEQELDRMADELLRAHRRVGDAGRERDLSRRELDAANAAMQECDGELTAAAERLKRLHNERAAASEELGMVDGQAGDLAREIADQRARLGSLERGGPGAPDEAGSQPEGADLEAERLEDLLSEAREAEVQARLARGAAQQRHQEGRRLLEALERETEEVTGRLAERERRRERRLTAVGRCADLAGMAAAGLARAEASLELAVAQRDRLDDERAGHERTIGVLRAELRETDDQLSTLRENRHREELARQELRHRLEALLDRMRGELGVDDPDAELATARRERADTFAGGDARDAELAESEERLVRKLGLLGTVNPLALSEFAALEERQRFLTGQLEDLRASRRDLAKVIGAVDERIRDIFAAAFTDVAVQFERIFGLLFPGGQGRLTLTDPEDLLETGVEVEARPPGKRVKRLSLLSGGERSLTALAVLFAIFAARPSPFYVLDEVEAALDDVNLQRFLEVVGEFRSSSQLIIVTHQQRTMEIADLLYGISMQPGGVSKVISQRMTEPVTV